jgi:hypothetical protein
MHQAVSCRPVAEQVLAQFQTNSRKICGGRSGNVLFFLVLFVSSVSPVSIIPPIHHAHSLIHSCITNANIISLNKAI